MSKGLLDSGNVCQDSVVTYLRELSNLLHTVKVTDGRNNILLLEHGAQLAVDNVLSVRLSGAKIMVIGNGGSAAIASHMQNDLCKAVGVRSIVFNEQPLLTAMSNDEGYERVFEGPIQLWANSEDILIAVSSSGKSENILRAARAGLDKGARLITLSGFDPDNPLRKMGELNFHVESGSYGYVEIVHTALAHYITDRASAKNKHVRGASS